MKKPISSFIPPDTEIARGKLSELQKLQKSLIRQGHQATIVKFHRADGVTEDALELPRELYCKIYG